MLFQTLIFIPTITVFFAAKMAFLEFKLSERVKKIIITGGSCTFGIYLIEQIMRAETEPIFYLLEPYIHTLPACWIWIAAACLLGGVITYFIKKIPGVKKFI